MKTNSNSNGLLRSLQKRLGTLEERCNDLFLDAVRKRWIPEKRLAEMLEVGLTRLYRWRKQGVIAFSKIGRKIWYRWSDVEAFLESGYRGVI